MYLVLTPLVLPQVYQLVRSQVVISPWPFVLSFRFICLPCFFVHLVCSPSQIGSMAISEALGKIKPDHPSLAKWVHALADADIFSVTDVSDLLEDDWVQFVSKIDSPVFKSALQSLRPFKIISPFAWWHDREHVHHHVAHYAHDQCTELNTEAKNAAREVGKESRQHGAALLVYRVLALNRSRSRSFSSILWYLDWHLCRESTHTLCYSEVLL